MRPEVSRTDDEIPSGILRGRRSQQLLLALAGAAVVIFVSTTVFLGEDLWRNLRQLNSGEWESPEWSLNHTENEFLRLHAQLTAASVDQEADLSALRLSFDIFYSRLETIERGQLAAELREIPDFMDDFAIVQEYVDAAVPLIDGPDAALRAGAPELLASSEVAYQALRKMSLSTLENWTHKTVERRKELATILLWMGSSLAVSFLMMLVALGMLSRMQRLGARREWYAAQARDRAVESEAALRESEARFRRAASLVGLGHFSRDGPGGPVVGCSEEFAALFGMDVKRYLDLASHSGGLALIHPGDRSRYEAAQTVVRNGAPPRPLEYRIQRADGEVRHIREVAQAGNATSGDLYEGIILDITEEVRSEERLRQSEGRLREAQSIAKIGSWMIDGEGNLDWSDETLRMFGMTREEFDGTISSFHARCHPDDREAVINASRESWYGLEDYDLIHRIVRPCGEVRVVHERAKPIPGPDGITTQLLGTVQDITEQSRAEERLRQSQKMEAIGQLTGGVAHDFNNLLTVIMGNLEMLREFDLGPDQLSFVEAGISASLRGAELTRNMLSFARQARLSPKNIDLNETVREMEAWAHRVLPATIELNIVLEEPLSSVVADPNSSATAILNLILNARDAMPEGGRLTLETRNLEIDADTARGRGGEPDLAIGNFVMVRVSDTGHGISKEDMDLVFEPFFTSKPPGSGTGLGLSMVMGFMQQSGGTVRVESEPGRGSAFTLLFPAKGPAMVPQPVEESEAELGKAEDSSHCILLVEDEPEVLSVIKRLLLRVGYVVTTAQNGDRAAEIFEQSETRFDLLVTDAVMPGKLQGVALARHCRMLQPDLPVVMLSGYAQGGQGQVGIADAWLMKPVQGSLLLRTVSEALSAPAGKAVEAPDLPPGS